MVNTQQRQTSDGTATCVVSVSAVDAVQEVGGVFLHAVCLCVCVDVLAHTHSHFLIFPTELGALFESKVTLLLLK